jgi:hypothetical protein
MSLTRRMKGKHEHPSRQFHRLSLLRDGTIEDGPGQAGYMSRVFLE